MTSEWKEWVEFRIHDKTTRWCVFSALSVKSIRAIVMGPSFLEGDHIMYRSCPSVRLSRAYFFLRIVLGTWALTRTKNEIPTVKILQGRPHSGRPPQRRTLLFYSAFSSAVAGHSSYGHLFVWAIFRAGECPYGGSPCKSIRKLR